MPQPDGPAIDTYSPFANVEVDAGERVGLHFVGEEDLGDASSLMRVLLPLVPARGVGLAVVVSSVVGMVILLIAEF